MLALAEGKRSLAEGKRSLPSDKAITPSPFYAKDAMLWDTITVHILRSALHLK